MRLIALFLLFAAGVARADEPALEFDALDLDHDGYVTLAEAAGIADVVTRFDRADRNRDGRLSPKEFSRLSKIKLHAAKTRRARIRSTLARDVRAAQHQAVAEAPAEPSAAAGGSARGNSEKR
jgi:hypothetical protein